MGHEKTDTQKCISGPSSAILIAELAQAAYSTCARSEVRTQISTLNAFIDGNSRYEEFPQPMPPDKVVDFLTKATYEFGEYKNFVFEKGHEIVEKICQYEGFESPSAAKSTSNVRYKRSTIEAFEKLKVRGFRSPLSHLAFVGIYCGALWNFVEKGSFWRTEECGQSAIFLEDDATEIVQAFDRYRTALAEISDSIKSEAF